MLSGLLLKTKKNLVAIGAFLLAVLAFFARLQFLKNAREKAERKADTLRATVHAERVKRDIIKEEEGKLLSRRSELIKEIKKIKPKEEREEVQTDSKKEDDSEKFKGIDNLTNPNDF